MNHHLVFHAFDSPARLILGGLAILAAAFLLTRLLQFERQLVPPRASRWLLGLRLAVVILLGLALAEPAMSISRDLARRGRIVIAIDRSESMTMTDVQSTSAEKLRWARGLGLIGNDRINPRLDRWIADLDAEREPRWIDPGETEDPERQKELSGIRRTNLDEVLASVARLSRQQVVDRLLAPNSELVQSLSSVGDIEYRVFGGQAQAISVEAITGKPPESLDISLSLIHISEPTRPY